MNSPRCEDKAPASDSFTVNDTMDTPAPCVASREASRMIGIPADGAMCCCGHLGREHVFGLFASICRHKPTAEEWHLPTKCGCRGFSEADCGNEGAAK
jgi:hypothetical protein